MLHITNGDCAADRLRHRSARLPGEVLAWKDVLHEGPVPAGLSLTELRPIRARFIAGEVGVPEAEILGDFERRDGTLAEVGEHDEVVLWFEHDLYDQLQLLQLLDWFAGQDLGTTRLSMIVVDAFPGVDPFYGLGQLRPRQLRTLFPARVAVTPAQLELARWAWAAFRSPDPTPLPRLLDADTSALPFLGAALLRYLEQFPATRDGLSRTERQILEAVAGGAGTPLDAFRADQEREQAPFMGDLTYLTYLHGLGVGTRPLLRLGAPEAVPQEESFRRQVIALTDRGRDVLAGRDDRLRPDGIDRWLGGVHLKGQDAAWRWEGRRLVPRRAA